MPITKKKPKTETKWVRGQKKWVETTKRTTARAIRKAERAQYFESPKAGRHNLEPGKFKALMKRRAKNKLARATHRAQRKAIG